MNNIATPLAENLAPSLATICGQNGTARKGGNPVRPWSSEPAQSLRLTEEIPNDEEIQVQWYDSDYLPNILAQVEEIDALIEAFNVTRQAYYKE